MKHTKKEIINALKVIQEECLSAPRCIDCPFYNHHNTVEACRLLVKRPSMLQINETEPETWRAFK